MLYTITEITKETVTLVSTNNETNKTIEFKQRAIDPFAYLTIGQEIETHNEEIPYSISLARRRDIREHHAEEARNGDI